MKVFYGKAGDTISTVP